jgi:hypothetical protein
MATGYSQAIRTDPGGTTVAVTNNMILFPLIDIILGGTLFLNHPNPSCASIRA